MERLISQREQVKALAGLPDIPVPGSADEAPPAPVPEPAPPEHRQEAPPASPRQRFDVGGRRRKTAKMGLRRRELDAGVFPSRKVGVLKTPVEKQAQPRRDVSMQQGLRGAEDRILAQFNPRQNPIFRASSPLQADSLRRSSLLFPAPGVCAPAFRFVDSATGQQAGRAVLAAVLVS